VRSLDLSLEQIQPTSKQLSFSNLSVLKRAMKKGVQLPLPGLMKHPEEEEKYLVFDGHHRLYLTAKLKPELIRVNIIETVQDVLCYDGYFSIDDSNIIWEEEISGLLRLRRDRVREGIILVLDIPISKLV
jgi:hypothetical protein